MRQLRVFLTERGGLLISESNDMKKKMYFNSIYEGRPDILCLARGLPARQCAGHPPGYVQR